MTWRTMWRRHPAVRTGEDLTLGERAADKMRNGMGSWPFVFGFLCCMIVWAVVNSYILVRVHGGAPFDPYPYILLNLILSTLAGLQGAILLIAAKRADQISSELAAHTFRVDEETLRHIIESRQENRQILAKLDSMR